MPVAAGANQIAIIRYNQMTLGILVDTVAEVISVPLSSVLPLPAEVSVQEAGAKNRSRYLKALIQRPSGVAALLNIDRLLEAIRLT